MQTLFVQNVTAKGQNTLRDYSYMIYQTFLLYQKKLGTQYKHRCDFLYEF